MGGKEKSLIEAAVGPKGGAALLSDTGGGQPHGGPLHQIPPSGNIAASGSQSAAGVFDQGTHHQVGPGLGGLQCLHKFAVAVVHQNGGLRVVGPHHLAQRPDLRHGEGRTGGVALGALDQHRLDAGVPHRPGQSLRVRRIVKQIYLPIFDSVTFQGTGALVHHADHPQHGVVGGTHGGHQNVAGLQRAKEGAGDGMGTVDKLHPY